MIVKLGDVCEKATSNIALKDLDNCDGEYAIYGASGFIKNVNFYQREKPYIAVVKDGAGVGRVMKLPEKTSVIGTMQYIFPKDNVNIDYLAYAMENMNLSKYYTGATIPHIYYKDYQKEEIFFPSLEEQYKIAETLAKVSDLIAKRKQQLEKLDLLVKSKFVDMFGDPVSNTKHYEEVYLNDLGILARGVSKHRPRNAPELLGGKYPLIQTGEVANSNLYITTYENTYSELGLRQSKMWDAGTLCITIAANIAKTAILTFDACFPDSIVGFMANENTNNIYIHFWFSFFQEILESQAPESAQKNINMKILSNLKIILPPINEQNQFSEFVKQTEKTKSIINHSLEKLETLKKALMQEYFGAKQC